MSLSPYRTMSGGRVYRRRRSRSPSRRSSTCQYTPPADRKTWSTGPVGTFSTTASRCPKGSVVAGDGENGERWCCALTQSVRRKYADTLVTRGMTPTEAVAAAVGAIPNRQAAAAAAPAVAAFEAQQKFRAENARRKAAEMERRASFAPSAPPLPLSADEELPFGLAEENAAAPRAAFNSGRDGAVRRAVGDPYVQGRNAAAARIQALMRGNRARRLAAEERFERARDEAAARRNAEVDNPSLAEIIRLQREAQQRAAEARADALRGGPLNPAQLRKQQQEDARRARRAARLANENFLQRAARAARRFSGYGIV